MARSQLCHTYRALAAEGRDDLTACLALRRKVFRAGEPGDDRDQFDALCRHVLIERVADGVPVACFRYLVMTDGTAVDQAYSAQFYDLSALRSFDGALLELGRFCIADGARDPDILRVAWGAIAEIVQAEGVDLMFGCSSFQGTDEEQYYDAFAMLRDAHIGPKRWLPRVKAPKVFEFAARLGRAADPKVAMRAMPPLLRTYLAMGGWVSDHAVVDRDLGTLHVFTGVEVRAIPPARRRSILAGVAS